MFVLRSSSRCVVIALLRDLPLPIGFLTAERRTVGATAWLFNTAGILLRRLFMDTTPNETTMCNESKDRDSRCNIHHEQSLQEVAHAPADAVAQCDRREDGTVAVCASATAASDDRISKSMGSPSPSTIEIPTVGYGGDVSRGLEGMCHLSTSAGESCGDGGAGGGDDVEERSNVQFPWKVNAS